MRAKSDQSLKGYKRLYEKEPISGPILVDKLIKNTYRTLMTRAMKGCYVYFCDEETKNYFKSSLEKLLNDVYLKFYKDGLVIEKRANKVNEKYKDA